MWFDKYRGYIEDLAVSRIPAYGRYYIWSYKRYVTSGFRYVDKSVDKKFYSKWRFFLIGQFFRCLCGLNAISFNISTNIKSFLTAGLLEPPVFRGASGTAKGLQTQYITAFPHLLPPGAPP